MIRRLGAAVVIVMAVLILGASVEDVSTRPTADQFSQ